MIYLTAIGLTPGGSSAVHVYTQTVHEQHNGHKTIHRKTQLMTYNNTINGISSVNKIYAQCRRTHWTCTAQAATNFTECCCRDLK